MPTGDCVEESEMFADEGIGIEIPELLVERSRTLQVREQERHVPDAEALLLIDPLRAEELSERLTRQQHASRDVGIEFECRLLRHSHDFRRPVDQE
jgi:hypothetical protein